MDSAGRPFDAEHVGYILAYVGLLGAVMQGGVLRRLLQRPIEKQLAVIGTIVLAGSMAWLAAGHSLGAVLLVCAGISIGNSLSTPTLNGLASRVTDAHCQGRVLGLMQSAGSLGRFLGPMLGFGLVRLRSGEALRAHRFPRQRRSARRGHRAADDPAGAESRARRPARDSAANLIRNFTTYQPLDIVRANPFYPRLMAIPLEDKFNDIVGKAMRGFKLSDSEVAEKAGVSAAAVQTLRDGAME